MLPEMLPFAITLSSGHWIRAISGLEFNLNDPSIRSALIHFTETGAEAGCPFCQGRMIASVTPGESMIILNGMNVGRKATVSPKPWLSDEFLVKFDTAPPDELTRIVQRLTVFSYLPLDKMPDWLCDLAIDDLCSIDLSALDLALSLSVVAKKGWSVTTLLPLITTVRQRRLPVLGAELWPTLEEHGVPKNLKHDFCRKFDFAIELLASLHGRPAVQKRRVRAMSIGRYLTPSQEEYFGPSLGNE